MTIKERAKENAYTQLPTSKVRDLREIDYIKGATDQDPISRADEKEKVLNEVCEWLRNYIASDLINKLRQSMEK